MQDTIYKNRLSELQVEQEKLQSAIDEIQDAIKNPEGLAELRHLETQLTNHKIGLTSVRLQIEHYTTQLVDK